MYAIVVDDPANACYSFPLCVALVITDPITVRELGLGL